MYHDTIEEIHSVCTNCNYFEGDINKKTEVELKGQVSLFSSSLLNNLINTKLSKFIFYSRIRSQSFYVLLFSVFLEALSLL